MSFVERNLKQDITVFSISAIDVYGNPTYTSSTIKGRWEDTQIKFVDSEGNETISTSVVFLDSDVSVGDYLYLGKSSATTPPSAAREIKSFSKIPDIRFKTYLRKAILR